MIAGEVPKSEMPKGVEHVISLHVFATLHLVPKSEMPKGVEHMLARLARLGLWVCRSQRCRKALSTTVCPPFRLPCCRAEVRDAERR